MADPFAINDKGDVLTFTGGEWKPAPVAQNDKGERMAFDGKEWRPLSAPEAQSGTSKVMDAIGSVTGPMRAANDWMVTRGIKVASGVLGAPQDLNELGQEGARYLLEKVFGPSPRTKERLRQADMQEPWSQAQIPEVRRNTMPGSQDIQRFMFGSMGIPEVNLRGRPATTLHPMGSNIDLGAMADVGAEGALSMLAGPGGVSSFARNALPGFIGGATSEAAGQSTKGSKYEVPARLLGAIVGGGATMLGQAGAEKGAAMLAPWTQAGKQRLAGDIIGGVATDPRRAVTRLANYTDAVPGVNQTAPKITGDEGLLSLENYVRGAAGSNNRLMAMDSANNAARTAHLGTLESGEVGNFVQRLRAVDAGLAADVDRALAALPASSTPTQAGMAIRDALGARQETLAAARRTVTQPLYDEVAQWALPVDARNARVVANNFVDTTKDELQNTARTARNTLYTGQGQPDNTAQGLVAARQALANRLSKESTTAAEGRILQGVQRETDRALEESVPAARLARGEYERMSAPLEPFGRGTSAFNILNENRPLDPAVIPQMLLQPGQRGVAGVRSMQATGAPGVTEPMRGYVGGLVRGAPERAGSIAETLGPGLEQLDPTLRPQIAAVGGAQEARTGFQASPMGRMAQGNDAAKELGSVLGARDGRRQISEMVVRAGNDQAALRGLRQGILDDFKTAIESRGGTDVAGNQTLMSAQAKRWVENKMQAANAALTTDQQKGIRALVDSLDIQSRTAPKMAGSDTVRNAMSGTFMGKILSGGISNIPGVSTLLKTAKTQEDVLRIVADTLADPQGARVMLMRYNEGNARLAEPILKRLAKSQPALAPLEVRQ